MAIRIQRIELDIDDPDPNNVFEDQTTGGAGSLVLDGAGVVGGEWLSSDGTERKIALESAGNISGVNFTITGFQNLSRGVAITETLAGPNANTVYSTNYFAVITSIAVDGAVGTNTEGGFDGVGSGGTVVSPIIMPDRYDGDVAMNVTVTGTINWSIQQTFDKVNLLSTPVPFEWLDHDDFNLVNQTVDRNGNYQQIPNAIRVLINTYSSGAELIFNVSQKRLS